MASLHGDRGGDVLPGHGSVRGIDLQFRSAAVPGAVRIRLLLGGVCDVVPGAPEPLEVAEGAEPGTGQTGLVGCLGKEKSRPSATFLGPNRQAPSKATLEFSLTSMLKS